MNSFNCPICNNEYPIIIDKSKSNKMSKIPGTTENVRYFQTHENHALYFEISDKNEIVNYTSLKLVKNVMDTLVHDNVTVSKVINSLIKKLNLPYRPVILFITDVKGYKQYLGSMVDEMIRDKETTVSVEFNNNYLIVDHDEIGLIISSIDEASNFLQKEIKSLNKAKNVLKSFIIDTTYIDNSKILDILNSRKTKIKPDVKGILAFNNKITDIPPMKIREILLETYKIKELDLLNYQDTNGLKSIILQSYYNLTENPLDARDEYEKYIASFF